MNNVVISYLVVGFIFGAMMFISHIVENTDKSTKSIFFIGIGLWVAITLLWFPIIVILGGKLLVEEIKKNKIL